MAATDDAIALIAAQLSLVEQLQAHANEAIARSDWQNVDKIAGTINTAFGTFLQGVQIMAIDVSALKNVLQSGGLSQDSLKQLTDKVTALGTDVADIKAALEELNAAATPTPAPVTPTPAT